MLPKHFETQISQSRISKNTKDGNEQLELEIKENFSIQKNSSRVKVDLGAKASSVPELHHSALPSVEVLNTLQIDK